MTVTTSPAVENTPPATKAAILRAIARSPHPRLEIPAAAHRHHLTVDDVKAIVTKHGGTEFPLRLLKAAAILEENVAREDRDSSAGTAKLSRVAITLLQADPENVREDVGDVTELADSLVAVGLLQPVVARRHNGRLIIVAGHRRLAAARSLGWTEIDVVIHDDMRPDHVLAAMLVENGHRRDLDPIEEARGLRRLKTQMGDCSDVQLARRVGRSAQHVGSRLALLSLSPEEQEQVRRGEIGVTAASEKARLNSGRIRPASKGRPGTGHLSVAHPLATRVQARCTQLGHSKGKGKGVGGVACGECWETVIRADEREQMHAKSAQAGDCVLCSSPIARQAVGQ